MCDLQVSATFGGKEKKGEGRISTNLKPNVNWARKFGRYDKKK